MKEYREIAGSLSIAMPTFILGREPNRQVYTLIDAYCEDPQCVGCAMAIRLVPERSPESPLSFDFDAIDTKIYFDEEPGEETRAVAKEFVREQELLLMRRRQIVRGWGLTSEGGREDYEPGRMYGFLDFCDRRESYAILFRYQGKTMAVVDLYCVNPDCSCTDAQLQVFVHRNWGKPRLEFVAHLDLSSGNICSADREPLAESKMAVVAAFQESLGDWKEELSLRRDLLLQVARKRIRFAPESIGGGSAAASWLATMAGPQSRSSSPVEDHPRPGRNDPCPCGSG